MVILIALSVLVLQFVLSADLFASAAAAVRSASWSLLALAGVGVLGSVACYSAVRAITLRAAGTPASGSKVVRLTVAAGALNATVPGGAVFSTAYAFRTLRSWGVSSAAASWSLLITGVLSTAAVVIVALSAGLLGGESFDLLTTAAEIGLLAAVLVGLIAVTRDPGRLAPVGTIGLRLVNRLRRRPSDHGLDGLHRALGDLGAIRPTGRQASAAASLSLLTYLFEIGCLAACLAAVGVDVSWSAILLSYAAGKAVTSVSPLPAGLGAVEGAMLLGLTAAGAPATAALAGVFLHRVWTVGGPAVAGWLVLGADRFRAAHPAAVVH